MLRLPGNRHPLRFPAAAAASGHDMPPAARLRFHIVAVVASFFPIFYNYASGIMKIMSPQTRIAIT
jgi:hypothetical protein